MIFLKSTALSICQKTDTNPFICLQIVDTLPAFSPISKRHALIYPIRVGLSDLLLFFPKG